MYMNDIKLLAKNGKELETLIQAVRIYKDLRMEFGRKKSAMLIIESGKRQMTEGIEQSNQEKKRTLGEKESYKYLGILEADTIKHAEKKEQIKKARKKYSKLNFIAQISSNA